MSNSISGSSHCIAHWSRQNLRSVKRNKKRARLAVSRAKKERPQKPFQFLSLPPELRDYIYELALTEEGGLMIVSSTKSFRRIVRRGAIYTDPSRFAYYRRGNYAGGKEPMPARGDTLSPNLLAVNKQIRAEGTAWLYQQPLILQDTMTLHTFLAAIGPTNREAVTEIIVEGWGCGRGAHKAMNVAALTSLADCTNLRKLHMDCNVAAYRRPRELARQLYRDGHFFFERFGAVKGKKDAIVDVLQLSENNFDRSGYYWGGNSPTPNVDECRAAFVAELRRLLGR